MSNSARDGAAATAAASCRRTTAKRGLRAMRSSRRTTAGHRVCLRPKAVANARTASHTIWRRQNGKCRDSGSCDGAEVFDDVDAGDAAKDEEADGPEDDDDDEDDGGERGVPCLLAAAACVGGAAIGDDPYRLAPRATLPLPKVADEREDRAKPLPKAGRAGDVMGSAVANDDDDDDDDNDDDEDDEDDDDDENDDEDDDDDDDEEESEDADCSPS